MSDEVNKIIKEMKEKETKPEINWMNLLAWTIIIAAIVVPIVMIVFDFGSSEEADTYEEMKTQTIEGSPWPN